MTSPRETGRRVLVVDDHADATETLSLLLSIKGHTARQAADGDEAIAVAEEFKPEIILLDLSLPGIDGFEVARQLRTKPYGKDVVLVAVTGWAGRDVQLKAADAGFDFHLLKPITWETLEQVLETPAANARP